MLYKEKGKEISQDDMHKAIAEIQKITDAEIAAVDKMLKDKEAEIMTV